MRPPTRSDVRVAAATAAIVGTILCMINGSYRAGNVSGIGLNYLVPLLVSLVSRLVGA